MSYLSLLQQKIAEKRLDGEPTKPTEAPFDAFVGDPEGHISPTSPLPATVIMGLRRLRTMPAPRGIKPEQWMEIVTDASRLAADGWAVQALALGWEPYALWGVDTSTDAHPWDESLAVILRGRRICAVDEGCVYIATPNGMTLFNRRARAGLTKYLWELGA